jgi:ArsR family transcriptional regulator
MARIVAMLRALANPARLNILQALDGAERSVAELELTLQIGQPFLSQHLAELRAVGAVAARRDGRSVYYRLRNDAVQQLVRQIWGAAQAGAAGPARPSPPADAALSALAPARAGVMR